MLCEGLTVLCAGLPTPHHHIAEVRRPAPSKRTCTRSGVLCAGLAALCASLPTPHHHIDEVRRPAPSKRARSDSFLSHYHRFQRLNPLLDRSERALVQRLAHRRSDRVQIDVGRTWSGAQAQAYLMSFIETAKQRLLEPFDWLRTALTATTPPILTPPILADLR